MGGAVCGMFTASTLCAGAITLLETGSRPRTALISAPAVKLERPDPTAPSSLFIGRQGSSLFADVERVEPVMAMSGARAAGMSGTAVSVIRQIIGQAESSHAGYDAVQHGARIKPLRLPTQMTVAEIYKWIDDTPGQPHAIGRYQFIPTTLRRVMRTIDASPDQRFSPGLQDKLADVLLAEAGYYEAKQGELSRRAFMNNLAKIWAGLPNDTGRSHYHGYAGNKASMSWARFDAEMAQVFAK
jgi:muramidase (phage lysozyme)